ncbi:MAG: hypothetical protein WCN97_11020 [Thermoleophilia bacterium]
MTNRRSIALLGLLTAGFAIAVIAAFANGDANAGAEARAKGATAVPATALAYASVNLDRNGTQFQTLEALAAKVQGGKDAVAKLNGMLDGKGQQAQVVRALGGDVSVGLVGITLGADMKPSVEAVVVATAADGAALPTVLKQAGFAQGPAVNGQPVWEQGSFAVAIDGSTAIGATSRATLTDALATEAGQKPALADDAAFQATIAKLPGDAVAIAYIAPARLAGLVQLAGSVLPKGALPKGTPDVTQSLAQLSDTLKDVRGLGIAVTAEQGGLRVVAAGDADQAALNKLGLALPTAYTPSILTQVPADALGFAAFRNLGPTLQAAITAAQQQDPQVKDTIAAAEATTGIKLADLLAALGGEHAVVAVGGKTPAAALLTQPQDPAAAGAMLAKAITSAQSIANSLPMADTARKQAEKRTQGPLPQIAVTRQGDSATLAIGTDARLAATPSSSIVDSDAYRAIVDRAGVPSDVTGIAYVNAGQLRAQAKTMGATVPAGLDALNGVVAWGTADGATLFISIG